MEIRTLLIASLFVAATFSSCLKAQNKSDFTKWPVPDNVPGLLFYIQRDPDINTVCYTTNLLIDGSLNQREPIDIFWIKYATDGKRKKLNALQREYGYGLSFTRKTADNFLIKAAAFPNRPMELIRNKDKKFIVQIKIEEQLCVLQRVYIHITGGTALSPDIDYIEFYGLDSKTNQLIKERINLR